MPPPPYQKRLTPPNQPPSARRSKKRPSRGLLMSLTLLARVLVALVAADAGSSALDALAPLAVMLAYRRPLAFLTLAPDALVVADAAPSERNEIP